MKSIIVKRIDDCINIDDQVLVFRESFGRTEPFDETKSLWTKKHYQNPVGHSYIFGAFDEERLVGINAFMPLEYTDDNETYKIAQSCESGVIPEYRGYGIWSKIIKFAMSYFTENTNIEFLIGFPNYKNSYNGFLKLGWKHQEYVDNLIFINNSVAIARGFTKFKPLLFCSKILEIPRALIGKTKICNTYQITSEVPIDLIKSYYTNNKIFRAYNMNKWLKWKFDYCDIKCITISKDNKCIATCLYKVEIFRNREIIKLYRILCDDNFISEKKANQIFIKLLIQKYQQISFIRYWTNQKESTSLYKKLDLLSLTIKILLLHITLR